MLDKLEGTYKVVSFCCTGGALTGSSGVEDG